ncbi:MAG TPA: DUF177 domain-containing protein [Rubricoccaceae bacterium]
MLRVRIAPLPDGRHTETLAPSAESLDLDPTLFSDVAVDLRLDTTARQTVASFVVSATAHLVCDRTDEPFDQAVRGEHTVVIVPPDAPIAGSDDEDVLVVTEEATHADLAGPVRDTLMLALPIRRVSPAAETLEIPTAFGAPADDEPKDDRWAALRALRGPDGAGPDAA